MKRNQYEDASIPLHIVEGEKAAAAMMKVGFLTVGLGGCNAGMRDGKLVSGFDNLNLKNRTVYNVADSDIYTNPNVQRGAESLATALRARGAIVHIIRLSSADDGSKFGPDDFLIAHGARALRALIKQQSEHTALVTVRLADVSPEHVTFLWFPYLPLGKLTLLEGNPGQGKSFIALQIAADLSQGRPLPGMKP